MVFCYENELEVWSLYDLNIFVEAFLNSKNNSRIFIDYILSKLLNYLKMEFYIFVRSIFFMEFLNVYPNASM